MPSVIRLTPLAGMLLFIMSFIFSPAWAIAKSTDKNLAFQVIQGAIVIDKSTIESATVTSAKTHPPSYDLNISLKLPSAYQLAKLTKANIGRPANIIFDNKIISSTIIQGKLAHQFTITGLSKKEATKLARSLKKE